MSHDYSSSSPKKSSKNSSFAALSFTGILSTSTSNFGFSTLSISGLSSPSIVDVVSIVIGFFTSAGLFSVISGFITGSSFFGLVCCSIHLIQQKLLPKILKPQIQNLKNHLLKTKWKNLRKNQQLRKNQ